MVRSHINQHEILAFLIVGFGWTWTWDAAYFAFGWWDSLPVYINSFPRQWGLPIGAVVVVWSSDVPLQDWVGRVFQWRYRPVLYLGALLIPLFITNVQPIIAALGGGTLRYSPPGPLHLLFGFLLLNVVLFGGVEEFGWRGFLQPQFQEHLSVLTSGLAVGVLWWAWHLPLFLGHPNFIPDPGFLVFYTAFVLGASTVLGALINITDGGVLPAVLMHATINVGPLLSGGGGVLDEILPIPLLIGAGAWWLITIILLGLYGRSMVPGYTLAPLCSGSDGQN